MHIKNIRNIEVFVDYYNKGQIIYKDGLLFKMVKTFGADNPKWLDKLKPLRMNLGKSNDRYYRVSTRRNGEFMSTYEHLVIYAIHYGIESFKQFEAVDHIDGNKLNNRVENLEGVSTEENNIRAKKNGLLRPLRGEDNPNGKLTKGKVSKIRELYSEKTYTQYQIADMFGIGQSQVSAIVRKKAWK